MCRATESPFLPVSWVLFVTRRTLGRVARFDFCVFVTSVGVMVAVGGYFDYPDLSI